MASTLKDKNTADLLKSVADMKEQLRTIRFGGAGSRSRNVREGRNVRREIARMLTELRARELDPIASKSKNA